MKKRVKILRVGADVSPAMEGYQERGDENLLLYNLCMEKRMAAERPMLPAPTRQGMNRRKIEDAKRKRDTWRAGISYFVFVILAFLMMLALLLPVE